MSASARRRVGSLLAGHRAALKLLADWRPLAENAACAHLGRSDT